ncbi:hypothetical protein RclHR1_13360002 [Rhizophagus clarus]|uniref:Uncharacterized protein n=1 Tax=Rhizophagus clarus TaxID=94130 RepID=A0A2Z6QBL8_9GLOM|nr:hypothetical protein RclHR1_13360002 [Rhizophagus clarus]GES97096.1 hypothetical protein RCL_jg5158.t1 [Rhizophagus clarus]
MPAKKRQQPTLFPQLPLIKQHVPLILPLHNNINSQENNNINSQDNNDINSQDNNDINSQDNNNIISQGNKVPQDQDNEDQLFI